LIQVKPTISRIIVHGDLSVFSKSSPRRTFIVSIPQAGAVSLPRGGAPDRQPAGADRRIVAAFQTASFPKVEGWGYSSVMATSNFRYTIEGLFAAFAGSSEPRKLGGQSVHRPYVFGAMCIAFGLGAAIGVVMTEVTRAYNPVIPATLLVIVLLLCNRNLVADRK
jgi:uncharacterized membrane protein YoaK (UPF0700 family)